MTASTGIRYVTCMRITIDQPVGIHFVSAYAPGLIQIGTRSFTSSLIVTASTIVEAWRPSRVQEFEPADVEPLLSLGAEVLLIGSGEKQAFPSREVLAALYRARVGFEIMDTGAACRTYNVLVAEGRNVAAALMLHRN
jgi:uncharacterized protein